jgi:leucyl aminopeptidase
LTLSHKAAVGIAADALVIAVAAGKDGPQLPAIDLPGSLRRSLEELMPVLGVRGAADEVVRLPGTPDVAATTIVLTGLGSAVKVDAEALRRAAGAAVRTVTGVESLVVAMPAASVGELRAVVEGALLGGYAYTDYLGSSKGERKLAARRITVVSPLARDRVAKTVLRRAEVVSESVALTKDLVNCPPNDLFPQRFAEIAAELADQHGIKVTVLDDAALREGGYGGLTAVGQGSARGPRLVRLSYSGGRKASTSIALVGKGITFDSGGLSIKPADAMKTMKLDMAGAAAVLGTVVAAARLKVPVAVTGWLALAENMPSGRAQRPSDVITILGGTTVEVLNTDAEGRLVLADAIVAAGRENPDAIVDIATLTGAQMVALGNRVSAAMGNDDDLRDRIVAAATEAGEGFWPMPLPAELRPSLDSPVADLANIGERMGGMLTAGLFLAEFVAKTDDRPIPWAHLDIAGPSFNEGSAYGYTGKGATGVGVRTLLGLVEASID